MNFFYATPQSFQGTSYGTSYPKIAWYKLPHIVTSPQQVTERIYPVGARDAPIVHPGALSGQARVHRRFRCCLSPFSFWIASVAIPSDLESMIHISTCSIVRYLQQVHPYSLYHIDSRNAVGFGKESRTSFSDKDTWTAKIANILAMCLSRGPSMSHKTVNRLLEPESGPRFSTHLWYGGMFIRVNRLMTALVDLMSGGSPALCGWVRFRSW
jgi:hypothetical protein